MDQDDHRDLHGDDEACTWSSLMEQQCLGVVQLGHSSASGTLHAAVLCLIILTSVVLCLIILTTIVVGVFYMLFISWPPSMFANHPSASCYMIPT